MLRRTATGDYSMTTRRICRSGGVLWGRKGCDMKRALIIAVTAALFSTALAGMALGQSVDRQAPARAELQADGGDTPDIGHILRRCRHLFGEDQLTDRLKERCLELWKRWCNAHPDARYCHRPDPKPHDCRITDRVIDRRCFPDRPTDRPTDRPVDRPHDRPSDRPVDRPVDRPTDRPVDRVTDRPVEGPPETADLDRDRVREPISDRATNGIHLRARAADL